MKKLLLIAAVIGLIAIPSLVIALNNNDDNNQAETSQENSQPAEDQSTETQAQPEETTGDITEQQAIEIAQAERPGQTVRKVEIETEDGAKIYSVRFTDDSRVDVRASDGQIVRNESGNSSGSDDGSGSGSDSSGRDHPEDN